MKPLALLLALCAPLGLLADSQPYGGQHSITATEGTMKVVHFHDWSSDKISRLFGDVSHHDAFFTPKNDFSYIEVTGASGQKSHRSPSPALSAVWISPDGKFIVGLSNVMLWNPYQLVVWRSDGLRLIHAEHISPRVARLTAREFEEFCQLHPKAKALFKGRTTKQDGVIYLDYQITGLGMAVGDDGWQFLFSRDVPNPHSDDFANTVTNYVYWFDESMPGLEIKEEGDMVTLSMRSPKGRTMRFEFSGKGGLALTAE